jgi:hypothetical protein
MVRFGFFCRQNEMLVEDQLGSLFPIIIITLLLLCSGNDDEAVVAQTTTSPLWRRSEYDFLR